MLCSLHPTSSIQTPLDKPTYYLLGEWMIKYTQSFGGLQRMLKEDHGNQQSVTAFVTHPHSDLEESCTWPTICILNNPRGTLNR